MVPLKVTRPITEKSGVVKEKIYLTISQLTIRDELWNPFDDVSFQYLFADVVQIDYNEVMSEVYSSDQSNAGTSEDEQEGGVP